MSFNRNIVDDKSKEEVLALVSSQEFKDIFLKYNIDNVIIFGSLSTDKFNEESDIDIAIIGSEKISSKLDLTLSLELEDFLGRSIDLIDINDEDIENIIKIEALNSDMVIMKNEKYDEKYVYYDILFKENIEFWNRLDKVILESE
ncbi:nucleotidyltransferase family protein [Clostridium disporicum]|uniref:DNA polymerase subunit beta n=1 Tax=Clostridium disporicum TaxID=84024 RepID=A0A173XQD6_9CLOT|nr:nucleotidyltransferase domain-containing protein [Clostridium disporicum]MDU6339817.1 nucleotidyltransferase domain-containing protein [Clostridium sp.]CUN53783.1 DNA polymerase subunit beta [Clostridium disporicum]